MEEGRNNTAQVLSSNAQRVGNTVLKKPGVWSDTVLELLRYLEQVGFGGAPRVVGGGYAEDGRMTLSFVPGESAHPGVWPDHSVYRIGELLRELHTITEGFVPHPEAQWRSSWIRDVGRDDLVIGHGDAAAWNIVGRGMKPEALIDWDYAGPVSRLTELAYAVWLNAQLHDDDVAERHRLPDAEARVRQAHEIMDGYQLPSTRRAELVERMIDVAVQSARDEAVAGKITRDSTQAVNAEGYSVLWAITWRTRSASWMLRHRRLLTQG